MVFNPQASQDNTMAESDLAYDLRAFYAKIISVHLIDIYQAKKFKDYVEWLRSLDNLCPLIISKIIAGKNRNPTDKEIKEDKLDKSVEEEHYLSLRKELVILSNKYEDIYLGLSSEPKGVEEINNTLRKMESYLYQIMHKEKMFGYKPDFTGL